MHVFGADLVGDGAGVIGAGVCSITNFLGDIFGAIGTGVVNVDLLTSLLTLWSVEWSECLFRPGADFLELTCNKNS